MPSPPATLAPRAASCFATEAVRQGRPEPPPPPLQPHPSPRLRQIKGGGLQSHQASRAQEIMMGDEAQNLRTAMQRSPALHARLLRYAHARMVQTAQTAYANAGFTIEARLARWILMTDDRLEGDELPLTHDFLSMMLGVRRPGVTIAVQTLEGHKLIRAKRGGITVLDRVRLEEVADSAYGVSEAEYASVMGQA